MRIEKIPFDLVNTITTSQRLARPTKPAKMGTGKALKLSSLLRKKSTPQIVGLESIKMVDSEFEARGLDKKKYNNGRIRTLRDLDSLQHYMY